LRNVSLASKPLYKALSYVWGTEVADDTININGVLWKCYGLHCPLWPGAGLNKALSISAAQQSVFKVQN